MLHKTKKIMAYKSTHRVTCDFCYEILWDKGVKNKTTYWEAWLSADEDLVLQGDDVHFCQQCYNDAKEYLNGAKAKQREDNAENLSPKRKRLHSPKRNNSR